MNRAGIALGERGLIVNTASVAAGDGQIGRAAYAAPESGVVGTALPLARVGMRVVRIAPGIFGPAMVGGFDEARKASLGAQIAFAQRPGRCDEYAALVRHIVDNQMPDGETIRLAGAIRMAPKWHPGPREVGCVPAASS